MRIDILTVLPELLESPFAASIMQRAQTKGHVEIYTHNLRQFSDNKHRNVDDYQYGGGAGMVMSVGPSDLYITKELSIGSYVLSGGELAAAVVVDAVVRLIPGVLNDETSALTDSFQDGLLAPPVYTRPPEFKGLHVPEVLLSGNPKDVAAWREAEAYARTKERRPDLLEE